MMALDPGLTAYEQLKAHDPVLRLAAADIRDLMTGPQAKQHARFIANLIAAVQVQGERQGQVVPFHVAAVAVLRSLDAGEDLAAVYAGQIRRQGEQAAARAALN